MDKTSEREHDMSNCWCGHAAEDHVQGVTRGALMAVDDAGIPPPVVSCSKCRSEERG